MPLAGEGLVVSVKISVSMQRVRLMAGGSDKRFLHSWEAKLKLFTGNIRHKPDMDIEQERYHIKTKRTFFFCLFYFIWMPSVRRDTIECC